MRYDPIDSALFVENRKRLVAMLKPRSIAIVHSNDVLPTSADGTLPFGQNRDLFHLSGIDQEESILVLFPDAADEKHRELLFVRETSELIAIWEGAKLTKELAQERSGITEVHWLEDFEKMFRGLILQAEHVYLNINEHPRAAAIVETRDDRFRKDCMARFPLHKYERLAPHMHELRCRKNAIEVALVKHACDITEAGFRRVLGFLKPGLTEYEVEAEFAHEFLRRRSKGFAYPPIIASGINACVLHYLENDQPCKDGDLLLLDVAAEYANYNADMTRTIPVNGRFTARQKAVYNAVLRVFRGASAILQPGIMLKDYQKEVGKMVEEELIGLGLLEADKVKDQDENEPLYRKYFMHGTSHHLGLDVHDVGNTNKPVEEGMLFTIEPGIYIRDEGFGVRLENDFVIRDGGNIDLMATIPIEAEEIEDLMNA
ncbi:MAG: aminopeptidase P N-terminal domain-containing protein [Verrucomicrobiae bacterium]|nr:aminopeptidase P N-terminal domain-containing protein [Verrucomicrobiae bacterium]